MCKDSECLRILQLLLHIYDVQSLGMPLVHTVRDTAPRCPAQCVSHNATAPRCVALRSAIYCSAAPHSAAHCSAVSRTMCFAQCHRSAVSGFPQCGTLLRGVPHNVLRTMPPLRGAWLSAGSTQCGTLLRGVPHNVLRTMPPLRGVWLSAVLSTALRLHTVRHTAPRCPAQCASHNATAPRCVALPSAIYRFGVCGRSHNYSASVTPRKGVKKMDLANGLFHQAIFIISASNT